MNISTYYKISNGNDDDLHTEFQISMSEVSDGQINYFEQATNTAYDIERGNKFDVH